MNPKIAVRSNGGMISNGETLFFNFDNGLRVKAFLFNGIVTAAWAQRETKRGYIDLIETRETMGSDSLVDFLSEVSKMNKKDIQKLGGIAIAKCD
jgi:hypothetical protein